MASYADIHGVSVRSEDGRGGLTDDHDATYGYASLYLQQQRQQQPQHVRKAQQQQHQPRDRSGLAASTSTERPPSQQPPHEGSAALPSPVKSGQAKQYHTVTSEGDPDFQPDESFSAKESPAEGSAPARSRSSSPTQRLDPSVTRPATTALAQAAATRMARLKRLAQRQQAPQQSRKPRDRPPVLLSVVLQQAPHLYDRQRLSAVERYITRVDPLPPRYTDAQVVYLSKNSLTSVSGLEQFSGLRVLGLADNLLADAEDTLARLAEGCPGLEALSLDGNPLAYVPHYRARAIIALPGLKSLDGRPVTDEERSAAPAAVAGEEVVMAVLLRNAAVVHKMASVVQRAQVHMELMHAVHSHGGVFRRVDALEGAASGGTSLARLLELWDYEGGMTEEERHKVYGALQREVGRMYRQLRSAGQEASMPAWEEAFAQVMAAQQHTQATLLDLLAQCQAALGQLVRSMAEQAPPGAYAGSRGGVGGMLRDAEESERRQRAYREEREAVLAEFRDAAVELSGGSPLRPRAAPTAQRKPLKSALKRPSQVQLQSQELLPQQQINDRAAYQQQQQPSPPWRSARSSPPSPEAVERLMRARRGVAAGGPYASPTGNAVQAQKAPAAQQRRPAWGSGPNGDGRAMSAERLRPRMRQEAGVVGVGANAGNRMGVAVQRPASVDTSSLSQRGRVASMRAGGRTNLQRRSEPGGSPKKSPSPSPPLQHPAWRPAGVAMAGVYSAPSSPDYKDAAHAVVRAAREQLFRTQVEAGTSPPSASRAKPEKDTQQPVESLPALEQGQSPTRPGMHRAWAGGTSVTGPQQQLLQGQGPLSGDLALHMPHARASYPVPEAHVNMASAGFLVADERRSKPRQQPGTGGTAAALRASKGSAAAAATPAVAVARIDDLRRQVEESARETAELRRIAEAAAMPLPQTLDPAFAEATVQPWLRQEQGAAPWLGTRPAWPAHTHVQDHLSAQPAPQRGALPHDDQGYYAGQPGQDATLSRPQSGFGMEHPQLGGTLQQAHQGQYGPSTRSPYGPYEPWQDTSIGVFPTIGQAQEWPGNAGLGEPLPAGEAQPGAWDSAQPGAVPASPLPQPHALPASLVSLRNSGSALPASAVSGQSAVRSAADRLPNSFPLEYDGNGGSLAQQGAVYLHGQGNPAGTASGLGHPAPVPYSVTGATIGGMQPTPVHGGELRPPAMGQPQSQMYGLDQGLGWLQGEAESYGNDPAGVQPEISFGQGATLQPKSAPSRLRLMPPPAAGLALSTAPGAFQISQSAAQQQGHPDIHPHYQVQQEGVFGQDTADPGGRPRPGPSAAGGFAQNRQDGTVPGSATLLPVRTAPQGPHLSYNSMGVAPGPTPPEPLSSPAAQLNGSSNNPFWLAAAVGGLPAARGLGDLPQASLPGTARSGAVSAPASPMGSRAVKGGATPLEEFSVMRASLDVNPSGSIHPSLSGTPSHARQARMEGLLDLFGGGMARREEQAAMSAEPAGGTGVGTGQPWPSAVTPGPTLQLPARPATAVSVMTPAAQLPGPGVPIGASSGGGGPVMTPSPGGAVTTPGGTVVSVVDAAAGSTGTRVDVEEVLQEDSEGFKDQHIHLHIHSLTPLGPDTSASTPQLFVGHDGGRAEAVEPTTLFSGAASAPPPPSWAAGHAAAASSNPPMSSLLAPGSPLHEVFASGRLVYEKIERIKPAGYDSRSSRSGGGGSASAVSGGTAGRKARTDRSSTGRRAESATRGEHPGFGYTMHSDEDSQMAEDEGSRSRKTHQAASRHARFAQDSREDGGSGGDDVRPETGRQRRRNGSDSGYGTDVERRQPDRDHRRREQDGRQDSSKGDNDVQGYTPSQLRERDGRPSPDQRAEWETTRNRDRRHATEHEKRRADGSGDEDVQGYSNSSRHVPDGPRSSSQRAGWETLRNRDRRHETGSEGRQGNGSGNEDVQGYNNSSRVPVGRRHPDQGVGREAARDDVRRHASEYERMSIERPGALSSNTSRPGRDSQPDEDVSGQPKFASPRRTVDTVTSDAIPDSLVSFSGRNGESGGGRDGVTGGGYAESDWGGSQAPTAASSFRRERTSLPSRRGTAEVLPNYQLGPVGLPVPTQPHGSGSYDRSIAVTAHGSEVAQRPRQAPEATVGGAQRGDHRRGEQVSAQRGVDLQAQKQPGADLSARSQSQQGTMSQRQTPEYRYDAGAVGLDVNGRRDAGDEDRGGLGTGPYSDSGMSRQISQESPAHRPTTTREGPTHGPDVHQALLPGAPSPAGQDAGRPRSLPPLPPGAPGRQPPSIGATTVRGTLAPVAEEDETGSPSAKLSGDDLDAAALPQSLNTGPNGSAAVAQQRGAQMGPLGLGLDESYAPALQAQIAALGEHLSRAATASAGQEHAAEVEAALASLAATSAPLGPSGALRALEQQLVGVTLEREALERALAGEQAEVRLLQQELAMMGGLADVLEGCKAQLQEARLAVGHQAQELSEQGAHLAAAREMVEELEAELMAEKERVAQEAAAASKRHDEEVASARAAADSELANQAAAHAIATATLQAEHARATATLQAEHARANATLQAEHAAAAATLQAEHVAATADFQASHTTQLEQISASHAVQLEQHAAQHQANLEQLSAEHAAQLAERDAQNRAAVEALVSDHHARLDEHMRRLDEVTAEHRRYLEGLAARCQADMDEQERFAAERLAAVQQESEAAAAAAREAHVQEVRQLERRLQEAEEAAAEREAEAARQREALRGQMEEIQAVLAREREQAAQLLEQHSDLAARHVELAAAEADVRRRFDRMAADLERERRREAGANDLARRSLLRRSLSRWRLGALDSRHASELYAAAAAHYDGRACRAALRHWHVAVLRTRVLRSMAGARRTVLLRRVLASLKLYVLQQKRKARYTSIASAHHSLRVQARCLAAWRRLNRTYNRAVEHFDRDLSQAAAAHHTRATLRWAIGAWRTFVYQDRLPKTQRRRRAVRAHARRLLRKAWAGLQQQVLRRAHKRGRLARSNRRYRFALLSRAVGSWLKFVDAARQKRSRQVAAGLQFTHSVLQRWRRAAARSRDLKRGLAVMEASSTTRRLRSSLARWRAFVLVRQQAALAARLAAEHHRAALLGRCMWAWLQQAQRAAARQLHIKGMGDYQRMMQAALRWQRLVELTRRQEAVVDRAVRMYRHRVLAATQRAVLRGWRGVVAERRLVLRSAAVAFVRAFLSMRLRRMVTEWHSEAARGVLRRGRQALVELRSQLGATEDTLRQAYGRLEALGVEGATLHGQLQQAQSEVLELRRQLEEREQSLQQTGAALAEAERGREAEAAQAAARGEEVASLQVQREELEQQVNTLRQQVAAGEVSVTSLQEQVAALQRTLAAAQGGAKELGLQMKQQAARYEEQLLAARDDAAAARRELGSRAAAVSRLEGARTEGEAQLRAVRASHEALVASLRQDLRNKDAQLMGHTKCAEAQPAACCGPAVPAPAARPASPALTGHGCQGGALGPRRAAAQRSATRSPTCSPRECSPAVRPPLFEPSLVGPLVRPASATTPRRSAGAMPRGSLLRTSLLTQPLLQGRPATAVSLDTTTDSSSQRLMTSPPQLTGTATSSPLFIPPTFRPTSLRPVSPTGLISRSPTQPHVGRVSWPQATAVGGITFPAPLGSAPVEQQEAERAAHEEDFQRRRAQILAGSASGAARRGSSRPGSRSPSPDTTESADAWPLQIAPANECSSWSVAENGPQPQGGGDSIERSLAVAAQRMAQLGEVVAGADAPRQQQPQQQEQEAAHDPQLPVLTAGILGTLTHLREAMRSSGAAAASSAPAHPPAPGGGGGGGAPAGAAPRRMLTGAMGSASNASCDGANAHTTLTFPTRWREVTRGSHGQPEDPSQASSASRRQTDGGLSEITLRPMLASQPSGAQQSRTRTLSTAAAPPVSLPVGSDAPAALTLSRTNSMAALPGLRQGQAFGVRAAPDARAAFPERSHELYTRVGAHVSSVVQEDLVLPQPRRSLWAGQGAFMPSMGTGFARGDEGEGSDSYAAEPGGSSVMGDGTSSADLEGCDAW